MFFRLVPISVTIITTCILVCGCHRPRQIQSAPEPRAPVPPAREVPPPVEGGYTDAFLAELLGNNAALLGEVLSKKDSLRLQIIYTKIDRKENNQPVFTDYRYNLRPDVYFYPASTVKMPTALLALQRINELKVPGLTRNSAMLTGAGYSGQNEVFNDPNSPDGRPSVAQYVKKIFLVSDNDAFNRLYEFLGQQYINEQLHKMGYDSAEIIHRLERVLNEDQNRHTNPVSFYDDNNNLLYRQAMQFNQQPYLKRSNWLGNAFYRGNKKVEGPMDFSKKNRLPLADLHQILKSVLFPEAVPASQRFNLSPEDYQLVRRYMSEFPGESASPAYPSPEYWDSYCKFLYWGSEKGTIPKSFRIFNKVGDAYGFLIDVAYVVDFEHHIEFMLSAAMYCNSDGVLNDSQYDYDSVGFPFMKNLGRVIYDYELKRNRAYIPDLSTFKISYEK